MKLDFFTKSGKKTEDYNEDNIAINEQFGFVIDGATGYGSVKITDAQTDAKWYSTMWKEYLLENLHNLDKSITQIVNEGLEHILNKLSSFPNYYQAEIPPSAAIAIFRINQDKVEYFVLADCSLLFYFKNGHVEVVSRNDIREIDNKNLELILNTANEQNISILEAKILPQIREVMVKMFKNRNTSNGGWVLSNSFEAINHAKVGVVKLSDLRLVLALSDGYSQIYEVFNHLSPKQLADRVYNGEKLEVLYNELYALQQQDELCTKFPRTKIRDDSSAVKITF